jgi:SAM-dependent methyltransferase
MEAALYDEWFTVEDRHWWFVGRRALFLRMLRRALPKESPRILDVGCGTGVNLEHLEKLGSVVGLDVAQAALQYCVKRRPFVLAAGSFARLPFADQSFDVVTAFDVLEHDADPTSCLLESARVLKPGGLLLLSVPAYRFMWGDHDVVAHHLRRYRRPEVLEALGAAGFVVERATHLNTFLFPVALVFRQLKNLVGRWVRHTPRSDFLSTDPPGLNGVLRRVFEAEGPLLDRMDLPFGLTIAALARRPQRPAAAGPLRRQAAMTSS